MAPDKALSHSPTPPTSHCAATASRASSTWRAPPCCAGTASGIEPVQKAHQLLCSLATSGLHKAAEKLATDGATAAATVAALRAHAGGALVQSHGLSLLAHLAASMVGIAAVLAVDGVVATALAALAALAAVQAQAGEASGQQAAAQGLLYQLSLSVDGSSRQPCSRAPWPSRSSCRSRSMELPSSSRQAPCSRTPWQSHSSRTSSSSSRHPPALSRRLLPCCAPRRGRCVEPSASDDNFGGAARGERQRLASKDYLITRQFDVPG